MSTHESRPGHIRVGLAQAAWSVLAFAMGLAIYGGVVASEPNSLWVLHWLGGSATGLAVLAGWQMLLGKEVEHPLPIAVAGQVFAAVPDLLARAGVAHRGWMNFFAFHVAVDAAPLSLMAGLGVLLAAICCYLVSFEVIERRTGGRPAAG